MKFSAVKSRLFTTALCVLATAAPLSALLMVLLNSATPPVWLILLALGALASLAISGMFYTLHLKHRRVEQQLNLYREAIAATPYALSIFDHNDQFIDCNEAYRKIHQAAFEQYADDLTYEQLMRATARQFAPTDNIEQWVDHRLTLHRAGSGEHKDEYCPDGRWLRVSKHRTNSGATVSYGIDISDLKHRELQLSDSEKRYNALTQVAPVGIWQIANSGSTLFHNNALIGILDCSDETQLLDNSALKTLQIYQNDKLLSHKESQARLLRGKHPLYVEATVDRHPEKTLYIARSKNIESVDGEQSYMMVILDVSQRKQAERDIRYLAEHDPLTGLSNRNMLNLKLHYLLQEKKDFAIVLLDLDHFKDVNDSLGHQIGDRLIKESAERIKKTLRTNDFASRLGGDEFAIVLPDVTDLASAHAIIKRIYSGFKEPVIIENNIIPISASAGIALYPEHGNSEQELIQHADIALYHQKNLGRGSFTLFETALANDIQARKEIEQDLRRALHNKQELSVNYQPQFNIQTSELTGVEALVRWKNQRTDQWVSPADFIPIAEQSGLIYLLDKWVLTTAASQIHKWHQMGFGHIVLASNLSTVHFRGDTLTTMINDVIKTTSINPASLELEITEGLFLEEQSHATDQLDLLRSQGIRVAVDDFGTGYSNLGYLNNLPVDSLKIDRSFIDNFDKNNYYRSIVNFIIELGNNLGLDIIAEGIETQNQLDALVDLKCSHGQGYFLARPQPAEVIEKLLIDTVPPMEPPAFAEDPIASHSQHSS